MTILIYINTVCEMGKRGDVCDEGNLDCGHDNCAEGFSSYGWRLRSSKLRKQSGAQHQTYALGIKEVWEVKESNHKLGSVLHTVGWPLDYHTYGGSFLYHVDNQQVVLGFVVALDYQNPYLSPYDEYQRFKHHSSVMPILEGGKVIQYGARSLNESGIQSIPKTAFPGGTFIGCLAGLLNVPKIKGSHIAMKTGMLAAEATFDSLSKGSEHQQNGTILGFPKSIVGVEGATSSSEHPSGGSMWIVGRHDIAGIEDYVTRGLLPYTLRHGKPDHASTEPAELHEPIEYPKPDGVISFEVNTSLHR